MGPVVAERVDHHFVELMIVVSVVHVDLFCLLAGGLVPDFLNVLRVLVAELEDLEVSIV